jgi:hypothetical protein
VDYEQYLLEPAYRSPSNQILHFRAPMQGQRMAKSAEFVSIPPLPLPLFRQSLHLAVSKNAEFVPPPESGAALYIHPVMIGFGPSLLPSPALSTCFISLCSRLLHCMVRCMVRMHQMRFCWRNMIEPRRKGRAR